MEFIVACLCLCKNLSGRGMFHSAVPSTAWAYFCSTAIVNILSTFGLSHIHGGGWEGKPLKELPADVFLPRSGGLFSVGGVLQDEHLSDENKRTKLRVDLCSLFTNDQGSNALHLIFSQHTATSFLVFLNKAIEPQEESPFCFLFFFGAPWRLV
jgi:hypothetical protein